MISYLTDEKILPDVTPDPVFAFNNNIPPQFMKEEILKRFDLPEKYILFSFFKQNIGNNWAKEFELCCKKSGYQCIGLPMPEKLVFFSLEKSVQLPLDTLDWYYLIKYSAGYVGERMHPIIASLHNNKSFYSFDHYGVENSRMGKLLEHVKLKKTVDNAEVLKSSKIYDILCKAGLLDNYYSYKAMNTLPTPKFVFDKLMTFDIEKCKMFNNDQTQHYEDTMAKTIEILYSN
jgi:hypothetical protein